MAVNEDANINYFDMLSEDTGFIAEENTRMYMTRPFDATESSAATHHPLPEQPGSQTGGDHRPMGTAAFVINPVNKTIVINTEAFVKQCKLCCNQFPSSQHLRKHEQSRTCVGNDFFCKEIDCKATLMSRKDLFNHYQYGHHYKFACDNVTRCGRVYKNLKEVRAHQTRPLADPTTNPCYRYLSISAEPSPKMTQSSPTQPTTTDMGYTPDITYFHRRTAAKQKGFSGAASSLLFPSPTTSPSERSMLQADRRQRIFTVDTVQRFIFIDTDVLDAHCDHCCHQFASEADLSEHHKKDCRPHNFPCGETGCLVILSRMSELFKHWEDIHSYRYACYNYGWCMKDYALLSGMRKHHRTPSTEKWPNRCYRPPPKSATPSPKKAKSTSTQSEATATTDSLPDITCDGGQTAAGKVRPGGAASGLKPTSSARDTSEESMLQALRGEIFASRVPFRVCKSKNLLLVDTVSLSAQCDMCYHQLSNDQQISEHKNGPNCKPIRQKCGFGNCNLVVLGRKAYFRHFQSKHGCGYGCDTCDETYTTVSTLKRHQTTRVIKKRLNPCYRSQNIPSTPARSSPKKTTSAAAQHIATSIQPAATNMDYLPDNTIVDWMRASVQPPATASKLPAYQLPACEPRVTAIQLPAIQPHVYQPPATASQLPAYQLPACQPPVTASQLPAIQPHVYQPPATANQLPAYQLPACQPPVTASQLPVIQPHVYQPPATASQLPAYRLPACQPPVTASQLPAIQPHMYQPPASASQLPTYQLPACQPPITASQLPAIQPHVYQSPVTASRLPAIQPHMYQPPTTASQLPAYQLPACQPPVTASQLSAIQPHVYQPPATASRLPAYQLPACQPPVTVSQLPATQPHVYHPPATASPLPPTQPHVYQSPATANQLPAIQPHAYQPPATEIQPQAYQAPAIAYQLPAYQLPACPPPVTASQLLAYQPSTYQLPASQPHVYQLPAYQLPAYQQPATAYQLPAYQLPACQPPATAIQLHAHQPPATASQLPACHPPATASQPPVTASQLHEHQPPATASKLPACQPPATVSQLSTSQPITGGNTSALQLSPTLRSSSYSSDELIISSAKSQKRAISMYGEPTFQCYDCSKIFPTIQHLSEHLCECLFRS